MVSNIERNLDNRVVVITGGGSGIGAATARLLLEAGACVVIVDLHREGMETIAREFTADRVLTLAGDVGDPSVSDAAIEAGRSAWGRVDSVVANAGVGSFGGVLDYDEDRIGLMTTTNFLGTVWLARSAVAHFRTRDGGGDVIVVASVAGLGSGGGGEAVYAATKAAQIQFATSLDREVRSEGVRVSVVAPAAVNTTFAAATGRFGSADPVDGPYLQPEDVAHAIVTMLRQPRRLRTALWSLWSLAESN